MLMENFYQRKLNNEKRVLGANRHTQTFMFIKRVHPEKYFIGFIYFFKQTSGQFSIRKKQLAVQSSSSSG